MDYVLRTPANARIPNAALCAPVYLLFRLHMSKTELTNLHNHRHPTLVSPPAPAPKEHFPLTSPGSPSGPRCIQGCGRDLNTSMPNAPPNSKLGVIGVPRARRRVRTRYKNGNRS